MSTGNEVVLPHVVAEIIQALRTAAPHTSHVFCEASRQLAVCAILSADRRQHRIVRSSHALIVVIIDTGLRAQPTGETEFESLRVLGNSFFISLATK